MEDTNGKLPEVLSRAGFVLAAGMLMRTGDACAIEEATVPEGVTGLANGCFAGCRELIRVSLPSTLREIGVGAFQASLINSSAASLISRIRWVL